MCRGNCHARILIAPTLFRHHVLAAALLYLSEWPHAMAQERSDADLTQLSIEDLMKQKITSVSKTEQTFSDTAAAVFVVTQEDLRRSGVTNILEALRMVPGVQVARIDSNKWVITARGFNGRFANKLLVLIDGRTVYTPAFSGVHWETQDLILEDIERIEVIRPEASVWGANAVNGIINIITKNAEDIQGGIASVS
jgi:iron complex outermembrane recepter protein